jgi:ketosteroid isomerase-like protein
MPLCPESAAIRRAPAPQLKRGVPPTSGRPREKCRRELMSRWTVVALLLLWARPGSAQTSENEAARAALLRADNEWAGLAASSKDVDRIVSFWTDDAAIYPPREAPLIGKAAIRSYVAESLNIPGFSITWKPSQAVVAAAGDLGYTTGTNAFTFPDAQGHLTTAHGRYLTVWRKSENGAWRCVVDFWNDAPPAPGSAQK